MSLFFFSLLLNHLLISFQICYWKEVQFCYDSLFLVKHYCDNNPNIKNLSYESHYFGEPLVCCLCFFTVTVVTNLKGMTLNLTLTCPAVKFARRVYFGAFYVSRKDPLPPSYFTMSIFSLIELRDAQKLRGRERWLRNLRSYSFNI